MLGSDVDGRWNSLARGRVAHQMCDPCAVAAFLDSQDLFHVAFRRQCLDKSACHRVGHQFLDIGSDVVSVQELVNLA